ncbi:HNH endonuclease [Prescottella agglutinans]|uniref:AP2/ERF domain-containing protein n=1 Tax=Prescottella agglutinans TaxID=1644129 RepID=A0ABT6MFW4_9NOCA|nr:HNH endonuclease [Prescottella agglutinans]MDH6283212.1 hypothetical protein [Prescottella agglutinans]
MSTTTLHLEAGDVLLDEEDYERLKPSTIYIGVNGYAYISTQATGPLTVHSILMGRAPKGHHIDHVNGNKLDNRRENLRIVSAQLNQVNRHSLNRNNTSGVRGVTRGRPGRNPWRAQITVSGRGIYLGCFPTVEEAAAARKDAERLYFGEECPDASA